MNRKKLVWQLPFLILLIVGTVIIVGQQRNTPYQHDTGLVFGTEYHVTYQHGSSLHKEIEAELRKVDMSLSPFNRQSTISKVNNNEPVELDQMFTDVFGMAMSISEETGGAFDITVAPLVNAWGFGFRDGVSPDRHTIDSLMEIVGYRKVRLKDGKIEKQDNRMMLDCSSIAKGYGSDVVARMLERKGIENYMVEIGGEIVTKGISEKRLPWRIGVTKPTDDSLGVSREYQTVLNVTNKAMATSGNYRNFYYKNGKKYAHTIDPRSGRPVEHGLLSATVVAPTAAEADALATACMVLGPQGARELVESLDGAEAYLISSDGVWTSGGFNLEQQ